MVFRSMDCAIILVVENKIGSNGGRSEFYSRAVNFDQSHSTKNVNKYLFRKKKHMATMFVKVIEHSFSVKTLIILPLPHTASFSLKHVFSKIYCGLKNDILE